MIRPYGILGIGFVTFARRLFSLPLLRFFFL
jgi:hypothetical protein